MLALLHAALLCGMPLWEFYPSLLKEIEGVQDAYKTPVRGLFPRKRWPMLRVQRQSPCVQGAIFRVRGYAPRLGDRCRDLAWEMERFAPSPRSRSARLLPHN